MEFIGNYRIINTINYGKVLINLDQASKFGNAYFVMTRKFNKKLSGIVDNTGKEIIPLNIMELTETFINSDKTDAYFAFKYPDTSYFEYYHIKFFEDKCKLVLQSNRKDEDVFRILQVRAIPKYWVFEKLTVPNKYAIYDYKNAEFKTIFFDELTFLPEEERINNHAIYYSIDIVNAFDDKEEIYTSLCGFLDEECNFSSQILDTEHELYYDEYYYRPNTLSKRFNLLLTDLYKKAILEHNGKEDRLIGLRSYLYSSLSNNYEEIIEESKAPAKIIEFKKRN